MSKLWKHKWWLITLGLATPVMAFAAVTNTFVAGRPIVAAEVNRNFSDLDGALTALTDRVAALEQNARANPTIRTSRVATIPMNSGTAAVARCESGEILVGGGCTYLQVPANFLSQNWFTSAPFDPAEAGLDMDVPPFGGASAAVGGSFASTNVWTCGMEDGQVAAGANTFQAFAVCLPLLP